MSKKHGVSRREFIRGAATAAGIGAGTAAVSRTARADVYKSILPQTIIGANEKIRTGHIGLGGMGKRDLQFVVDRDDMQPIAVCDLNPQYVEQGQQIVANKHAAPTGHTYFEEIIENKDVDAVVVVTPDHWHTIPSIMAMEAGKDVYCEKPMSTTLVESQVVKDVVHRTKQVYQSGTMQRSGVYFQEAVNMIKSGYIGKIGRVETFNYDRGAKIAGIGNPPDENPPEWLDWDRFIGWTPKVPYNPNRYLYNFRWFTDYSGGKITDWGAHLIDIALWAMGDEKRPKSVTAMSGKYVLEDNRTTPDTLEVAWDFGDYMLTFSNRAWNPDFRPDIAYAASLERATNPTQAELAAENEQLRAEIARLTAPGAGHGIIFHGTLGSMAVDRRGYTVYPFRENGGCEPVSKRDGVEMLMNQGHWENFCKCVRDRSTPISSVDVSYVTSLVCLMGKSAYIANGGLLHWDAEKERFTGKDGDAVKTANEWLYREYQNGWSLKSPYNKEWKKKNG